MCPRFDSWWHHKRGLLHRVTLFFYVFSPCYSGSLNRGNYSKVESCTFGLLQKWAQGRLIQSRMHREQKQQYKLHIGNFSCHSLRKTFGRQVYNMNSENSELALVKLMEIFNHSSGAITKRYLGLRQEELLNTYDCLSF